MFILKHFQSTFKRLNHDQRGSMLVFILIFGSVATTIIISGVATYGIYENQISNRKHQRDMAAHIAEAGIDYYRWHLAHNPTDYADGTGQPGPYVHNYNDKDGNLIGYFSLNITPPLVGSSVVMVSSTGWTAVKPEVRRTLQVRVGFPALTDNTFLSNANMSFSATSVVNGTTYSNGGIKFEGTSDSWVRSAQETYRYNNQTKNGVWGGGGPQSFWEYPVPAVDFFSVSADLASIRDSADDGGIHLTSSGDEGWHIRFTGTTFDLFRVTSRDCYYGQGRWRYRRGWRWYGSVYCNDIRNETFVSSQPIPANGAIFVEDHVWVDGTVDGRVSLGVGRFPVQEPYADIYVTGNLLYNERSADDVTGLIAQGNIVIPYEVPDVMTIEAALLSQFGTIHRPYYWNNVKTSLTIFGSQIYYLQGGMKWTNQYGNVVSGFTNTNYLYDGNLRYYPPPGFPVGDTYDLISWEEVE